MYKTLNIQPALTLITLHWSLMRMPLTAPTPVPTITAVGVASPSEHGQAIAKTETSRVYVYKHKVVGNCQN